MGTQTGTHLSLVVAVGEPVEVRGRERDVRLEVVDRVSAGRERALAGRPMENEYSAVAVSAVIVVVIVAIADGYVQLRRAGSGDVAEELAPVFVG
jgi:hypothetical protein